MKAGHRHLRSFGIELKAREFLQVSVLLRTANDRPQNAQLHGFNERTEGAFTRCMLPLGIER